MPANQFGVDMGQVYRTKASVKGQRKQNTLSQMKIEKKKRQAKARENKNALMGPAAQGNQEAIEGLTALDPETAQSLLTARGKMTEQQRKETEQQVQVMGQMAANVLQAGEPEQQAQQYQRAREFMAENYPERAAQMPDQYDPNWMKTQLARSREIEKLMQGDQTKRVKRPGGVDVYRTDNQTGRTEKDSFEEPEELKEGNPLEASDENSIYRATVQAMTGLDITNADQASRYSSDLVQEKRDRIQAVAARATRLRRDNPNLTRMEAVAKARREDGSVVPSMTGDSGDAESISDEQANALMNNILKGQ